MYRWDSRENHSYVIISGFSKHTAIKNGEDEVEYRGGKYGFEVVEFDPDIKESRKIIKSTIIIEKINKK